MTSTRMQLLEDAFAKVTQYTGTDLWRPGLVDLFVYNALIDMYESDYSSVEFMTYLWRKTPDEVMESIITSSHIFDLEYGWEQLDEEIRDYLLTEGFIVNVDDVSDEEYKNNLEQRK